MGGKLAAIRVSGERVSPEGTVGGSWGASTDTVYQTSPAALLSIFRDIDVQRRWLIEQNPHYLLSHPTNIRTLALCFGEEGGELTNLRQVRTMGEMLPADLRELCREVWGVPVADIYTAEEMGYMALQCPEHEHYHVQAENVLLEVLDDEYRPCAPGQIGRVVVTALHNFASPLIRYEIMDYAQVGEPCTCGRGLPVLKRIVGRQRNMIMLPDGSQHWPGFGARWWANVAPIRQIQLVQRQLDRLEARLVINRSMTDAEQSELIGNLQKRLAFPYPIDIRYVDRIERSAGGKYEDFISLVQSH